MQGQITKAGENRYRLRVWLGRDANGRRLSKAKTFNGTKKEAQAALREWLRQIDTGTYVEPSKITVGELMDRWFRDYVYDLAPSTQAQYRYTYGKHIPDWFRVIPLRKVSTVLLNDLYTQIRDAGAEPPTIHQVHKILSGAFRRAVAWGLVASNPCRNTARPRALKPKIKFLLPAQARTLLQGAAGTDLHVPVYLGLHLLMRVGEVCGLRWTDLDLDVPQPSIQVGQSASYAEGRGVFLKTPKTARSLRRIEIPQTVARFLRSHRVAQREQRLAAGPAWQDHGLVYCRPDGQPWRPTYVSDRIMELMTGLDLPSYRAHTLRHTGASLMLQRGENIKVIQELCGHASIVTTLNIYGHLMPGMHRAAVENLADLLGGQDPPNNKPARRKSRG